jgi:hypothetical protein
MTRIILHGGYGDHWDGVADDQPLFHKLIAAAEQTDKRILISTLAYNSPADFGYADAMVERFHAINPAIIVTMASPDNFRDLLPQYQVLFVQGGNSERHCAAMAGITKDELLTNKTLIAGSSSGGMLLCKWGYSRSIGAFEGKGIVDLALMPHANSWPVEEFLPDLRRVATGPVLLLDELEMVELSV